MKDNKFVTDLLTRYSLIVLAGLGNLYIFYKILTPLTLSTLKLILSIFTDPLVVSNVIFLKTITIEIIPACVAGSAFYLLFILNLATPNIKPRKRLTILAHSFLILFILNIARILFLVSISGQLYFETIHLVFWHLISTVFIVGIWFYIIDKYKIKETPIYTDVMKLSKQTKTIKKSKRHKKNQKTSNSNSK